MNTLPIIIEDNRVTIRRTKEGVWLSEHEIARLFEVFVSAVGSNIRSILKNGILREEKVYKFIKSGEDRYIELYNLEMITALAFRLKSHNAELFRKWMVERATNPVVVWGIPDQNPAIN